MKRKTFLPILIMLCMLVSVFPTSVSAATVSSIVMSGNITPVLNQKLKFAKEPSHKIDDYTIIQMWAVDGKVFADNDMLNLVLEDEGTLLPENERVFKSGKSYAYMVAIRPGKAILADNTVVKLGSRKLIQMNTDFGEYTYSIVFCYDQKLHISSPIWKITETEHWLTCEDNDGYILSETKSAHDFDRETYACNGCGYVLPESKATTITKQPADIPMINCGDTLELSAEATGAGLRYYWRWGDEHSINDSNYWNGMKISGSNSPNLKIENFGGQYAEKYNGIYCYIEGVRGTAKTKIANITAQHNNNIFDPIDGNGHNIVCSCGKVMQESEMHTYDANEKCTKCGYKKGSTQSPFKSAVLNAPGFAEGKSVADSKETLQFDGPGLQSFSAEWMTSGYVPITTGTFSVNTAYILRIYPVFENNYYLSEGNMATITYNGKEIRCALMKQNGKIYFNILLGYPPKNIKMTFDSNGGEGTQPPLYADEYSEIYLPKCKFTKTGDEFFAWRVKEGEKYVLKSPDPDRFSGYKIKEDITAEAIWKSQTEKEIAITMDGITEGKTVSEMSFSCPEEANYRLSGAVTWYVGNSVDKRYKISGNRALSMNENYTIQMVLTSDTGFAEYKDLTVTLNETNVTGVEKRGLQLLVITIQILNNVSVELWGPMDESPLAKRSEMTKNSEDFEIAAGTLWYDKLNGAPEDKLNDQVTAKRGKKYYLTLHLRNMVENQVFGGDTVKVNGKDYPVTSRGDGYIEAKNIPFTATYSQVKISEESEGLIVIESPKDMEVTFAAALYDSKGKVIDVIMRPNFELTNGRNEVALFDSKIGGIEQGMKFLRRYLGEKVKIMILRNLDSLEPLCAVHNYKFIYR